MLLTLPILSIYHKAQAFFLSFSCLGSCCSKHAREAWVVLQIPVEDKAAAGRGGTVVQRLGVSRYHPLMLAGTATGTVLLYDLRAPRTAAATLKPHTSPMVGALAFV